MLSVNQINAQVKILEMWKANNIENYQLKIEKRQLNPEQPKTRSFENDQLTENGFSSVSSRTFKNDAIRVWNKTPNNIKQCDSLYSAKKCIKNFVCMLPF